MQPSERKPAIFMYCIPLFTDQSFSVSFYSVVLHVLPDCAFKLILKDKLL